MAWNWYFYRSVGPGRGMGHYSRHCSRNSTQRHVLFGYSVSLTNTANNNCSHQWVFLFIYCDYALNVSNNSTFIIPEKVWCKVYNVRKHSLTVSFIVSFWNNENDFCEHSIVTEVEGCYILSQNTCSLIEFWWDQYEMSAITKLSFYRWCYKQDWLSSQRW